MAITRSSGREPWIFRVDDPGDLIGSHPALIASTLQPGEAASHLIYSPAWEGSTAPFGLTAHPASHGIALTKSRWIISQDWHVSWQEPRVDSIPFTSVLLVEKGSAMLQAWLSIQYEDNGGLQRITILHKAIGSHHFDDAIRTYRRLSQTGIPSVGAESDSWQHIPIYVAQELIPVLVDGEHVTSSTHTTEQWKNEWRRWRHFDCCVQPWSAFLVTDYGYVYAEAEKSRERGLWAFGANVWCIPADVIRGVSFVPGETTHLHLALTRGSVHADLSIAVPSLHDPIVDALHARTRPHVQRSGGG